VRAEERLNVPGRLRAIAAGRGHQLALIDESARVTWAELAEAMDGAAGAMIGSGMRPGDCVGVAMEPSGVYVAVVLGALAAGVVPVQINTRLTAGEIVQFLEAIDPVMIVTDPVFDELAAPTGYPTVLLPQAAAPGSLRARLGSLGGAPVILPPAEEDAPAIIFPTGGTTGTPKGVFYDHRGLWLWMMAAAMSNPGDRFDMELIFAPLFHITLGTNLIARLFAGGAVWVLRRFDPATALAAIAAGATRITAAPTLFAALRDHPDFEVTPRNGMKAIRLGAMASDAAFVAELIGHYPSAAVRIGYGATEFGPVIGAEHADIVSGRLTGIGRPHPGAEVQILRPDGSEAEPGEVGEFVVRAPWQSRGYWGRPEETAATYRPEGIHIGDLGSVDADGWFTVSGRLKEMIITGGENVFPTEVEAVLRRHPSVQDLIVYGMPDERWGERIEVGVVPSSGAEVNLDALREFARPHLAGYKLPKTLRRLDAVPLTSVKKPDRRAARDHALSVGVPDRDG
jgi:fatty-acyl-CoA synthase